MVIGRSPSCVEAWPECRDGGYDPRCCRFPKSCSCGGDLPPFAEGDTYSYLSVTQEIRVTWTRDAVGVWTASDGREMTATDADVAAAFGVTSTVPVPHPGAKAGYPKPPTPPVPQGEHPTP